MGGRLAYEWRRAILPLIGSLLPNPVDFRKSRLPAESKGLGTYRFRRIRWTSVI